MSKQNIVIIDTSIANIFNVQRAFHKVGVNTKISNKKEEVLNADKIVLPGVGAFSEGMAALKKNNLIVAIKKAANDGKPLLGICLGMQMLMTTSNEDGVHSGLDLIKGCVKIFDSPVKEKQFKIPHYGWSQISTPKLAPANIWDNSILSGLNNENLFCYFVHSYFVKTKKPIHTIGETFYGNNLFASVIKNKNVTGCQFHPERSSTDGLEIINNFVNIKG